MDDEWDDSTEASRSKRATELRELAKDANRAETRALFDTPVFSEYQNVIEHVIPAQIEKWGLLVLRSNEQGQESLGALLKRMLKNNVNKRRTIGKYVRKEKVKKDGTVLKEKISDFINTATKESLAMLAIRIDAMHTTESRMTHKRRLGQMQKAIKAKGQKTKRERSRTSDHMAAVITTDATKAHAGTVHDNYQLDAQEY